LKEFERLQVQN